MAAKTAQENRTVHTKRVCKVFEVERFCKENKVLVAMVEFWKARVQNGFIVENSGTIFFFKLTIGEPLFESL